MKITKFNKNDSDYYWYCMVELTSDEWPALDSAGNWLDRPIRQWVYNSCQGSHFFAADGWIYFELAEDAAMFKMIWG